MKLEIEEQLREEFKRDIAVLLSDNPALDKLLRMKASPVFCQLKDVSFFKRGNQRRLTLTGKSRIWQSSHHWRPRKSKSMSPENQENVEAAESPELEEVVESEHEYLHQRLKEELGREPTEEELMNGCASIPKATE